MIIVENYDLTVPAEAEAVILQVMHFFESQFTDNIRVNFNINFADLGQFTAGSSSVQTGNFTYYDIWTHMAQDTGVTSEDITAFNSLPGMPPTYCNPNASAFYLITRANQKALGMLDPNDFGFGRLDDVQ